MIHDFEETCNEWFNTYTVVGPVSVNRYRKVLDGVYPSERFESIYFLLDYYGANINYHGQIISDGRYYAYVVPDWEESFTNKYQVKRVIEELKEPRLNLHCRTLIRKAIRKWIDDLELWPIQE